MNDPIFLLGTGRCGSTFWQRLLCAADTVWIWGEHDGLLQPLSRMHEHLSGSSALNKWAIREGGAITDINLKPGDATDFAWNNGFDLNDLKFGLRNLIDDLFARNLPVGKIRWGFKEIRYGPSSRVPELLLDLYEGSKIIVPVREPRETVFSSAVAWDRDQIAPKGEVDEAAAMACFVRHCNNWIGFHKYFIELAEKYPQRVGFAYLGSQSSAEAMFGFLNINWSAALSDIFDQVVNSNEFARSGLYANPALIDCLNVALDAQSGDIESVNLRLKQLSGCLDSRNLLR